MLLFRVPGFSVSKKIHLSSWRSTADSCLAFSSLGRRALISNLWQIPAPNATSCTSDALSFYKERWVMIRTSFFFLTESQILFSFTGSLIDGSSQEQGKAFFFGKQEETHSACLDFNLRERVLDVLCVKNCTNTGQSWRLFPAFLQRIL